MKKKSLLFLLAILAGIGTMFAESGKYGENLTWNLENSVLTISGTGEMPCDYTYAPWYSYRNSINSVIIGNGVTGIGCMAFVDCSSLTSVTIPNGVMYINDEAFSGCSSLTSVTIPNSVTYIGLDAFSGCSSLTSVTIPNSVTYINAEAFSDCSSLTSVTIPNSVTMILRGTFSGCSSLTSVTIPNNVTEIALEAFKECNNLTKINLNSNAIVGTDYNSSIISTIFGSQVEEYILGDSVTRIGDNAFVGCRNLTSVTIGDNVKSIGNFAFNVCTGLTSIEIPNSVTSIGDYAFSSCNLKSVTIPHSVTSIGKKAFWGNENLQTLTINSPSIVERDEELLQWAFDNTQVPEIIIGDGITKIGNKKFYGFRASFTLPNSVTSIGKYAFQHCGFKSIIIPNSVTEIGTEAFSYNDSLESVTLSKNVKVLYGFNNCTSLKSIDIPNGVTVLEAFDECTSLESVTIPNSVTYLGGFSYCSSLTSIDIPESVTSIGGSAFWGCSNLKSVQIPDGVTHIYAYTFGESGITSITIPIQIDSIEGAVFDGCDSLATVVWNARKVVDIGWTASGIFDDCKIKSLVIGEDVDSLPNFYTRGFDSLKTVVWNARNCKLGRNEGDGTLPHNISKITFGNEVEYIPKTLCNGSNIKTLVIPNSVKVIDYKAFENCDSLTSVILGSSINTLGYHAFKWCDNLTSVTCYATNPPTIEESFNSGIIVYVPAESVNAYKSADYWKRLTILPIGATHTETDDIHITPSENYADIIWKAIANAASYELYIKFMGNTWRFVFDAEGILTSIINHAPARNNAPQGTQSAGFSYTVMGLSSGTTYDLTITAKAANGSTLNTETASFTTTGEPQAIEDVNINNTQRMKIMRDGNVYILRGSHTYTLTGQELK